MHRSSAHRAAAGLLTLALTACGGGGVVPGGADGGGASEAEPPDVILVDCPDEVVEFVETLEDLDSRLNVGLNFQAYSERVGDSRVAYDRIDIQDLGSGCIDHVGSPAEDAMNAYIRAYNTWNDCIGDIDCDNDSITPDLQAEWAEATELVEDARAGLDR